MGRDESGKRIMRYASGQTADECLDRLAQKREEFLRASSTLREGANPALILRAFVEGYWLPSVRQRVAEKTLDRMTLDASYVLRYLGNIPLGEITPALILRIQALMQVDGLSDYQRFNAGKILRRIMSFAVGLDFLDKSPAHKIPLPKYRLEEIRPMTLEQVGHFLRSNREDRLHPLYVTALDTGAREGELFALEWGDWNPERREIAITKSVLERLGHQRLKEPKTRAGKRTVVVCENTRSVLEEYRAQKGASPLLFPNSEGGWLRYSNFRKNTWKPALARAGLEGFRFHDLRHTCATLLLMAGDNVRSIADRLGHSSPELILKVYGHVIPQMRRNSAQYTQGYIPAPDLKKN